MLAGGGTEAPLTAKHLASLGYGVALLADSDEPINPDASSLQSLGIRVFQWAGTVSIEERIALDLPFQDLKKLVQLAIDIVSSDVAVIDAICSRLGSNRTSIDDMTPGAQGFRKIRGRKAGRKGGLRELIQEGGQM